MTESSPVERELAKRFEETLEGKPLAEALDGIDVAYFLIHSMEAAAQRGPTAEPSTDGGESDPQD